MAKFIDLTSQVFGRLTVLYRAPNKNNRVMWVCRCSCGTEINVRGDQLRGGITNSCGCLKLEQTQKLGRNNFKDLTNQRFGKLVAIKPIYNQNSKRYSWLCQCDCGNTTIVLGSSLSSLNSQSCGCLKSLGESNIQSILTINQIQFIYQYKIEINNKIHYFDFALLDNNKITRLIEFDGIQHQGRISGWFTEERYQQLKINDKEKNQYALANNIPLVRIPYTKRDNITINMLLGNECLVTTEEITEDTL